MKEYNPFDWYWNVADTTQLFSSKKRDYTLLGDTDFVTWSADGTVPTSIDTEANLGVVLVPYKIRPIPDGILDGYLDEQMRILVLQPEFKLWLDVYATMLHPTPDEMHIRARIRSKL